MISYHRLWYSTAFGLVHQTKDHRSMIGIAYCCVTLVRYNIAFFVKYLSGYRPEPILNGPSRFLDTAESILIGHYCCWLVATLPHCRLLYVASGVYKREIPKTLLLLIGTLRLITLFVDVTSIIEWGTRAVLCSIGEYMLLLRKERPQFRKLWQAEQDTQGSRVNQTIAQVEWIF